MEKLVEKLAALSFSPEFWIMMAIIFLGISVIALFISGCFLLRSINNSLRKNIEPLYQKWIEAKHRDSDLLLTNCLEIKQSHLPRLETAICLPAWKGFTQRALLTNHKSEYHFLVLTYRSGKEYVDVFAVAKGNSPY